MNNNNFTGFFKNGNGLSCTFTDNVQDLVSTVSVDYDETNKMRSYDCKVTDLLTKKSKKTYKFTFNVPQPAKGYPNYVEVPDDNIFLVRKDFVYVPLDEVNLNDKYLAVVGMQVAEFKLEKVEVFEYEDEQELVLPVTKKFNCVCNMFVLSYR